MDNINTPQEKIIGGKFGLPETYYFNDQTPSFLKGNPILLFNARSGIRIVIDYLKPKQIWLPSYLCPTMVDAANQGSCAIKFYPIDRKLKIPSNTFIKQIKPRDIFLFIEYFGFPFDEIILKEVKEKKALLFNDCSQSLFSKLSEKSDFCLFSPRKFLGVPDGGILHFNQEYEMLKNSFSKPPEDLYYKLFQAVILRREFDLFNNGKDWLNLFNQGEKDFSTTPYSMSELSQILLKYAFNYSQIRISRRENFEFLASHLSSYGIFNELPDGVVPLGYPIRIVLRDTIQKLLFEKDIYPPIHWKFHGKVPFEFLESHSLSKEIMTLPCDQRYSIGDMEKIVHSLHKILKNL